MPEEATRAVIGIIPTVVATKLVLDVMDRTVGKPRKSKGLKGMSLI